MNITTPKYDLKRFPEVYSPSEDTFLLIDALEKESQFLTNLKPTFALEVGSGSGIVLTSLSQLSNSCKLYAVDINPQACLATLNTALKNNVNIECINANLMKSFRHHLFDIVLFNPPYVVTEVEEMEGTGLNCAWAGGTNGREIIDKFLKELPDVLSEIGVCYILLLKENDPEEIIEGMKKCGFRCRLVLKRKVPGEHLAVYAFFKDVT